MRGVRDDHAPRVDPDRGNARGTERRRHDPAAEQLADGGDRVEHSRRRVAQNRNRFDHAAQIVEVPGEVAHDVIDAIAEQRPGDGDVALPQGLDLGPDQGTAADRAGIRRAIQQPIRDAAKRRYDHDRTDAAFALPADDRDHAPDGRLVRNR